MIMINIKLLWIFTCFIAVAGSFAPLSIPLSVSTHPIRGARVSGSGSGASSSSSHRSNIKLYTTNNPSAVTYKDESNLSTKLQKKIQEIDNTNAVNNGDDTVENGVRSDIETIVQTMEKQYSNLNIAQQRADYSNPNEYDDFSPSSLKRFEPAFGYYNVTYVQSKRKGENPVGGKWTRKNQLAQKLLTTRRTMQHLLPVNSTSLGQFQINCSDIESSSNDNDDTTTTATTQYSNRPVVAEAINVITLDALWSLIRLSIILRGDAVPLTIKDRTSSKMKGPLTNLAVKAFFDPPRIVLGKTGRFLNLKLGPKSSVILDTTYLDRTIRIGKGGTSGTRFIFTKCLDSDVEAEDFKRLLLIKPTGKTKILSILIAAVIGGRSLLGQKMVGKAITASISLLIFAILFSTGGIEQDQQGQKNVDNK